MRRRRWLVLVLMSLLVLFLIRMGFDIWTGHRANAEVARIEQQYGSLDEHIGNLPSVPSEDNRARAVRAAAALTVSRTGAGTTEADFRRAFGPLMSSKVPTPIPANLKAFAQANQAALRVADEVPLRTRSNWDADYSGGFHTPPWMDVRLLGNIIYVQARIDLDSGRPDDAAKEIVTGLAVSASLRQEPDLIAQLIRCAMGIEQYEAVQRLLVEAEPSKASLEALSKWLSENRDPSPIRVGLFSELKHFNAALTRVENGDFGSSAMAGSAMGDQALARGHGVFASSFWLPPVARLLRPVIRMARVGYLEEARELLDEEAGPRTLPLAGASPKPPPWAFLQRLTGVSIAGLRRAIETGDLYASELGATELAVALRRFRLDHGQYPGTLDALVPAYFAQLPIDRLTDKPPVYARQGTGFRLHAERPEHFSPGGGGTAALDWSVSK
jgi:hypothetical protein